MPSKDCIYEVVENYCQIMNRRNRKRLIMGWGGFSLFVIIALFSRSVLSYLALGGWLTLMFFNFLPYHWSARKCFMRGQLAENNWGTGVNSFAELTGGEVNDELIAMISDSSRVPEWAKSWLAERLSEQGYIAWIDIHQLRSKVASYEYHKKNLEKPGAKKLTSFLGDGGE